MKSYLLCALVAAYSAAALMRELLPGRAGWLIGLIAFHLAAGVGLRFLTNARWFAASTALTAIAAEAALFRYIENKSLAISTGTLLELIPAMYFARRFFLTMGD